MSEFEMYFNRPKPDLAMIYEMLLRRVYHCGRNEDPFCIADTDSFSFKRNGKLETETLVGIWTATTLLIDQVAKDDISRVRKIRDLIDENPTKNCFQKLCQEIFKVLDKNGVNEFPHWKALPFNS